MSCTLLVRIPAVIQSPPQALEAELQAESFTSCKG